MNWVSRRLVAQVICWVILLVTLASSIVANVQAVRGTSGLSQAFAALAPLLTVLFVAVIESMDLGDARWYAKALFVGPLLGLAGGAFYISYEHQRSLLTSWARSAQEAAAWPIVVDLAIIAASAAIKIMAAQRPATRPALVASEVAVGNSPVVAAEVAQQLPAPKARNRATTSAPRRRGKLRRPAEETKALIAQLVDQDPDITNVALAAHLKVSPQRISALKRTANGAAASAGA